ncbi:crotonase/enoyl-CoA hydratase family protein [Aquipseudomonas ullengensis]|uniref:Crotonase/enoyl-CoA hydratase family protein n=1 Tax=Aquipseudomonas ullengensis TaxID=2759166 RepID=A0A7W4LJV4_9GAMM|nr:crotonase/enoyl-CoA hydratase family protein [Pseudomonas ullengensis]MBB2494515.1 crotonase/enoyl-CoA hydratase family protein [Pseudomonas ullengensis]
MVDNVKVERRGNVLCIGFNRPEKMNAMDIDLYVELAVAYGVLDADPTLRCGLLYGEGKHFTAGLELEQWAVQFAKGGFPALPEGACDPFGLDPSRRVRKPVVVATQGVCYTLALELMLAADVRVAADNCRFGQIEVQRGLYAVGGATVRFAQNIGWGNTMRYLLTGDEFDAHEAYRMGLVQGVYPVGQHFDEALKLAERIALQAPLGVAATLNSARISLNQGEQVAMDRLIPDLAPLLGSDDFKEGVSSFLERRAANFNGC